jgi:hypothetical protein
MAQPGTQSLIDQDATGRMHQEHYQVTINSAGEIEINCGMYVKAVFLTYAERIVYPASLSYEVGSDQRSIEVFSTDDNPRLVDVTVFGW